MKIIFRVNRNPTLGKLIAKFKIVKSKIGERTIFDTLELEWIPNFPIV